MIGTVGQLINDLVRVKSKSGFTLYGIDQIKIDHGRVTIVPGYGNEASKSS